MSVKYRGCPRINEAAWLLILALAARTPWGCGTPDPSSSQPDPQEAVASDRAPIAAPSPATPLASSPNEPDPHAHHHAPAADPSSPDVDPHAHHHDHGAIHIARVSDEVALSIDNATAITTSRPVKLEVVLTRRDNGQPLADLMRAPELQVRAFIVREDLAHFARVQASPVPQRPGHYSIEHRFAAGGAYRLYAEVISSSLGVETAVFPFAVSGPRSHPKPLVPTPSGPQRAGDLVVALQITPSPILVGDITGDLQITDSRGRPVTDLVPVRGDQFDVFILNADLVTLSNAHLHGARPVPGRPSRAEPRFHTRVAHGLQRIWIEVQRGAVPTTLSWVIEAR